MASVPILSGEGAFYKHPDYVASTRSAFSRTEVLLPSYKVNFESKIVRIAKLIFSIVVFPIILFNLLHRLLGRFVIPAALVGNIDKISMAGLAQLDLEGPWKYKRLSVEVDGCVVDACLMGREETFDNGRFVLKTVGNSRPYTLQDPSFEQFLTEIKGNAIVFDVPGVGASTGGLNHSTLAKAYRAMLHFLEDRNGLAAKEIVGYGFSMGGAVQAEGLEDYPLHNEIDYLFIKDRTFSTIADVGGPILGLISNIFRWNVKTVDSSLKLKAKEIIIQTAKLPEGSRQQEIINDPSVIIDDGKLPTRSALAQVLLAKRPSYPNKVFVGTSLMHSQGFIDPKFLGELVNNMMVRKINDL